MFCSVCVFTSVKAHSATIIINVGNKGVSPSHVNVIKGDTIVWQLNNEGNYQIVCDGFYPGTNLPAGAEMFNFLLNGSQQFYSYIPNVKGEYDYKCLFGSSEITGKIYAGSPLPVELTDFVATTIKNEVILDWATSGELNNDRFEIQRIEITDMFDYNPDNLLFNTVGIIEGNGTSNEIHHYNFIDKNLKTGVYLYRLMQVDFNSNFLYHYLTDEINIGIPNKFNVGQNYPNPFNPSTNIGFEIPEVGNVKILLLNSAGQEIRVLENTVLSSGYHYVKVNGADLPSGVYFYNFVYSSKTFLKSISKKMLLLK